MTNVIQFPTLERVKQVINEKINIEIDKVEDIETQKEECVELAFYCFDLMDQAIIGSEYTDGFEDMNFDDIEDKCPESKDMTAIINLIAAMLYRYKGLQHPCQEDLDNIIERLDQIYIDEMAKMEKDNSTIEDLENEIEILLTEKSDDKNDTD